MNVYDVLMMNPGDRISKTDLYNLIVDSKNINSSKYLGENFVINNTPQQGINWIGSNSKPIAVLLKSYAGKYAGDGSIGNGEIRYAFKARESKVNLKEKANQVLTNQPIGGYPLLYFQENGTDFIFFGKYSISEMQDTYVTLKSFSESSLTLDVSDDFIFSEGGLKLVQHLSRERNNKLIMKAKSINVWICEICEMNTEETYGVRYIEAHHRVPLSFYEDAHSVSLADVVLLCPTCHRIVHKYMMLHEDIGYDDIKKRIQNRLKQNIDSLKSRNVFPD